MKANKLIRQMAKEKGVKHWQIAEYLGISEPTIMRWLRTPLNEEKKSRVLEAIENLAKGNADA